MNYDAPTVRNILGAIRKDPLDTEIWHNLLIHCFDQKDPESFESYQIISDCLDNLVRAERLSSIGRGSDGKILLTTEQRQTLIQLSLEPSNPVALEALGRILFQDFGRRAEAHRIFSRAAQIDPVNAELNQWLERCGDGAAISPAALDIEPGDAPTAPVQSQKSKEDIRRMLRVTSMVARDTAHHRPPVGDVSAAKLPAPVALSTAIPSGSDVEKDFLEQFDRLLTKAMEGRADDLTAGVDALAGRSPGPAAMAGALSSIAHIFHARGHFEAALELNQRAIAAAPTLTSLYFYQATIYHGLGRHAEAKAVYQDVIGRFPDHGQAWKNLGVLHYELEQYEDAEKCFRKALALQPGSAELWGHLVSVLIERGDLEGALGAVDQLVLVDPENRDAILKRGVIHLQMNDLAGAETALAEALEKDPESAHPLCYLAIVRARNGRVEDALELCGRAAGHSEIAPLVSTAWMETAIAFESVDDLPHAMQCFKASVEMDPSQARAWTRIGLICRREGALEESEMALAQAVKADPSEARAWSELGVTRYKVGRYPEAAEAFLKAASLAPTVSDWPYNAGVALEKANRSDEAARAYERAVKVQTDHASARINLGLIYVQQGHPLKAASCLQGLVLIRPDYARAWFGLGLVYEGMHKWDESVRALEKAVQLDTTLLEAHSHLAYVYRKIGRTADAEASTAKAQPRMDTLPGGNP